MRVVFDIEANGLEAPDKIWLIVCKDLDTGKYYIFRDGEDWLEFEKFSAQVSVWIGHNVLGYDIPHIERLLGVAIPRTFPACVDTLIVSKLMDYSREGHSIEQYGEELGYPKIQFTDFSRYSQDMETYCIRDVDINERVYRKYARHIDHNEWTASLALEHAFSAVVNDLERNGFNFNVTGAERLLARVNTELGKLDKEILDAFPPREVLIREFIPRATKFGTISKTSIPRSLLDNVAEYEIGKTYRHTKQEEFNPSSHKQIIQVLNEANWSPINKTKTHIDTERQLNRLKYGRRDKTELDLAEETAIVDKLKLLQKTGWKVDEENLQTLPEKAPASARLLAKRIMLESRRRTLTEWLGLVWYEIELELESLGTSGIETNGTPILFGETNKEARTNDGVKTTSKSHVKVIDGTTSNIPTDSRSKMFLAWLKSKKVDARFARENESSLWIIVIGKAVYESFCASTATPISVGTKKIQPQYKVTSTRIHGQFNGMGAWSHRMNHQKPNTANIPNATDTNGKLKLYGGEMRALWCAPKNRLLVGVDAEGIQLRIFAHYINDPEFIKALVEGKKDDKSDPHSLNQRILGAKSRNAAKRFIFAYLLGGGLGKLSQILEVSEDECRVCLDRLLERYSGLALLKETIIPGDAKRGYFKGIDGRLVKIPGETPGQRKHLCMSGYLQNGEAVVMKAATLKWADKLDEYDAYLVNLVHDEWQVEAPNNVEVCLNIAHMMADSLRQVGEEFKLNCPLAGSFWNDDLKDYTIGTNWKVTH